MIHESFYLKSPATPIFNTDTNTYFDINMNTQPGTLIMQWNRWIPMDVVWNLRVLQDDVGHPPRPQIRSILHPDHPIPPKASASSNVALTLHRRFKNWAVKHTHSDLRDKNEESKANKQAIGQLQELIICTARSQASVPSLKNSPHPVWPKSTTPLFQPCLPFPDFRLLPLTPLPPLLVAFMVSPMLAVAAVLVLASRSRTLQLLRLHQQPRPDQRWIPRPCSSASMEGWMECAHSLACNKTNERASERTSKRYV